jgi:hypothetical protein
VVEEELGEQAQRLAVAPLPGTLHLVDEHAPVLVPVDQLAGRMASSARVVGLDI